MNLLIMLAGIALAVTASQPQTTNATIRTRRFATAGFVALFAVAPFISPTTAVLFDALTAMCVAYGWNFIGGYTGYAAFGNVAYLGLGSFVAAGFMSRQPGHLALPWYVGIPLAVIITSLVAALFGLVVLRLKGHYFSIATLGISVAMPEIINWDLLFGKQGIIKNFFGGGLPLNFPLLDDLQLSGRQFSADRFLFYYLGLATALIAIAVTFRVTGHKFGYAIIAIRENEEAASVMGIDTTVAKIGAYVLSAALAALGGSIIGYKLTNMTTEAEALFSTTNNLQMIIICLIGGIGTIWGPAIGALVLFGLQEALRSSVGGGEFLAWQGAIFSALIVLVVLFLPNGMVRLIYLRYLRPRTRVRIAPAVPSG